jgi:shikimate kinase
MDKSQSMDHRRSVALIGMAGVGKSTVGRLLAERLGRTFIDTDDLIREATGQSLQSLIEDFGLAAFLEKEAEVFGSMEISDEIIATGGSAVYGQAAMEHLKRDSWVVWLQQDQAMLIDRIGGSPHERGLAMRPGQSLENVIAEREPLYAQYADIVIHCRDGGPLEMVEAIRHSLKSC